MIEHVAFVMYPVTDMARAAAFYEDGLGLRRDGLASDYWIEYDVAGVTFGIGNFEQVGKPGTANALAIEVDDVAAFRKQLADRGYTATQPHDLTNCLISVVHDPDGNNIWLHQRKT